MTLSPKNLNVQKTMQCLHTLKQGFFRITTSKALCTMKTNITRNSDQNLTIIHKKTFKTPLDLLLQLLKHNVQPSIINFTFHL